MSTPGLGATPSTWHMLRRFWPYARPHVRWLWLGLMAIPVVAGVSVFRPLLLKDAVDHDIPAGDIGALRITAALFLATVAFEFLAQAVQVYALQRAGQTSLHDFRSAIFHHILRLPSRFFDTHAIGSLVSRTTSDIEALSEVLAFGVFTILTDVVMITAILVAMLILNPGLTVVSLALAPVLVVLVRWFSQILRRLQLEIRKAAAVQAGYLTEQLSGVTVVQLFRREATAERGFAELGHRHLGAIKSANIYDALLYSIMDGIAAGAVALLLWFAAPAAVQGDVLTLGVLFAFVDYLQRVFVPIREFSGKLATIQRASASLERIYGLLDEPAEIRSDPGAIDPLVGWEGRIRVSHLSFRYREDGPEILRDVSFEVGAGEVVAVVGRTGSGKTTLGRLLTSTYTGWEGSIELWVGERWIDSRSVAPDILRRHALLVQQDVFLFDSELGFNVALRTVEDAPDRARVEAALATVQLDEMVASRGLDLALGERGRALSAGEAQLVALARVAERAPQFLILDEATASVDTLTEVRVQKAIDDLFRARSALVIAHRLSTVRNAHRILVLQGGSIVEEGAHEALLGLGGLYAELYRSGLADEVTRVQ